LGVIHWFRIVFKFTLIFHRNVSFLSEMGVFLLLFILLMFLIFCRLFFIFAPFPFIFLMMFSFIVPVKVIHDHFYSSWFFVVIIVLWLLLFMRIGGSGLDRKVRVF
jgi:hypothetical protein